jgi:hypothetical protein
MKKSVTVVESAGKLEHLMIIGKFADGCRQIFMSPETQDIILEVLAYPDNLIKVDEEILEGVDIIKRQ